MNEKLLGILSIAALAGSGLAEAGNVTLRHDMTSGVAITSKEVLTCANVACDGANQRPFNLTNLQTPVSDAPGGAVVLTSDFAAILNSGSDMTHLSSLLSLDTAAGATNEASSDVRMISSGGGSDIGSFALNGNQIMGVPGASSMMSESSMSQAKYSDPIVSASFNSMVAGIVLNTQVVAPSSSSSSSTNNQSSTSNSNNNSSTSPVGALLPNALADVTNDTPTGSNTGGVHVNFSSSSSSPSSAASFAAGPSFMGQGPTSDAPEPGADLLIGAGLIAAGVFSRVSRQGKQ
ncbi:MAG TPA: hypothetical protein VGL53_00030 [Bryobacteraceae bacterium]